VPTTVTQHQHDDVDDPAADHHHVDDRPADHHVDHARPTTSTTTTSTTISTTTTIPSVCTAEPTFPSLACRIDALLELVRDSSVLGPLQPGFVTRFERAQQLVADGAEQCGAGQRTLARQALDRVDRQMLVVRARTRTHRARKIIPPASGRGDRGRRAEHRRGCRLAAHALTCPDGDLPARKRPYRAQPLSGCATRAMTHASRRRWRTAGRRGALSSPCRRKGASFTGLGKLDACSEHELVVSWTGGFLPR
jgi:hypothetical protein